MSNLVREYAKNPEIKKTDVENLKEWAEKQPHLPNMTEYQCLLFLQSCYSSNEQAKAAIENYFTARTIYKDIFYDLHPKDGGIQLASEVSFMQVLPELAPSGYKVMLFKLLDTNPDKFILVDQVRYFDMIINLFMQLEGTNQGFHMVFDCEGAVLGHLLKFNPILAKKYLFYFQEALPIRLKDFHVINAPSWIDKLLGMIKVFLKAELIEMIRIHNDKEELFEIVPREILPENYGHVGKLSKIENLAGKTRKMLDENPDFFVDLEKLVTNESKRVEKSKNYDEMFGSEGTFKKLEVD